MSEGISTPRTGSEQGDAKHSPGPWKWSDSGNPADAADWMIPGTGRIRTFGDGFATRTVQLYAADTHTAILTASERDTGDGNPDGIVPEPADMSLIAAAPDLLAACKAARQFVSLGTANTVKTSAEGRKRAAEVLSQVLAAIAKAEGGVS